MTLSNWQASYNGLTMGGAVSGGVGLISIDGLDLPSIRSGDVSYPHDDGMLAGYDFAAGRDITLSMEVVASGSQTLSQALDTVNAAFQPSKKTFLPFTYLFPGISSRTVNCRVRKRKSQVNIAYVGGMAQVDVMLSAVDPRIYDTAGSSGSVPLPTPSSGMTFPATFPLTFGGTTGGGGIIYATNSGDTATYPVATITGPVVNPRIQNTTTSDTLGLTITLIAGDVLVLDFQAHTAILNGNGYRLSSVTSPNWWALPANSTSTIGYFSSDAAPTGSTLTLNWASAWM